MIYKETEKEQEVPNVEVKIEVEHEEPVSEKKKLHKSLTEIVEFRLKLIKDSVSVIENTLEQIRELCDEGND